MERLAFAVIAGLILVVPQSAAAQTVQPWNHPCGKLVKDWQSKPKHKAIAIANGDYNQACGISWGASSIEAAKQSAIKSCRGASESAPCSVVKAE